MLKSHRIAFNDGKTARVDFEQLDGTIGKWEGASENMSGWIAKHTAPAANAALTVNVPTQPVANAFPEDELLPLPKWDDHTTAATLVANGPAHPVGDDAIDELLDLPRWDGPSAADNAAGPQGAPVATPRLTTAPAANQAGDDLDELLPLPKWEA